jgi:hypothetical protein
VLRAPPALPQEFAEGVYVDEPWSSVLGVVLVGEGTRANNRVHFSGGVADVRDPCVMHPARAGSGWQGVATEVLVKGTREQRSGRLETRPNYVRVVEVAGSSPGTSISGTGSGDRSGPATVHVEQNGYGCGTTPHPFPRALRVAQTPQARARAGAGP